MRKTIYHIIITVAIMLLSATPALASNAITLSANTTLSGDGYIWDNDTLTLTNYNGCQFKANIPITVLLHGDNKISAGPNGFGLDIYGSINIEGNGTSSLTIDANQAGGIHAQGDLEINNTELNITSNDIAGGSGIIVGSLDSESRHLLFNNVTGSIAAFGSDEDKSEAVFSQAPIQLVDTTADKLLGMLIDEDAGNEYTFVNGTTTTFRNPTAYENNIAEKVVFTNNTTNNTKREDVIVKGEILDLQKLHSLELNQKYTLQTKRMKRYAKLYGNGKLKGTKKGDVVVNIKDTDNPEDPPLWATTITILSKPKLKFPKLKFQDNMQLNANDYFKTKDTQFTTVDTWNSSNKNVAEIDDNGIITIKNSGKTKISATFSNVKVSGILRVTQI